MNDQLPDFEPEQTTEPAAQPPKKRRKPMRRKAAEITTAPKRRKMLRKVKAEVIRRGRPKGSVNKPKATTVTFSTDSEPAVVLHAFASAKACIQFLSERERSAIIDRLKEELT